MELDIQSNRAAAKWNASELLRRALWEMLRRPLFAWTPRQLWAWRRVVLRAFGARIGCHVHIYPNVKIAIPWNVDFADYAAIGESAVLYSLGTIKIGRGATVSQYAHLCAGTHDHCKPDFPLLKLPISIGDGAWICADAFIGPGVTVGSMAVVGARAVAVRDVPPNSVVAGNPARMVGSRNL